MQKLFLSSAAGIVLAVTGFFAAPAVQAMTTPLSSGITSAIQDASLIQNVELVCRRVRRCGPYGCGWRRQCWDAGPRYYGGYGYAPRRGYYGRGTAYPCGPGWSIQDGVCKPYRGY
jgi:hypothetical protein